MGPRDIGGFSLLFHPLKKKVSLNITNLGELQMILTKFRLVKAMVFPVVMYGCDSWTVKKAEHRRIDAFELWFWRRLLRISWSIVGPKNPSLEPLQRWMSSAVMFGNPWCRQLFYPFTYLHTHTPLNSVFPALPASWLYTYNFPSSRQAAFLVCWTLQLWSFAYFLDTSSKKSPAPDWASLWEVEGDSGWTGLPVNSVCILITSSLYYCIC